MTKYWAGNKQVQTRGFRIIKMLILGSFGILVCAYAIETVADFIKLIRDPSVLELYCTSDCDFFCDSRFILFAFLISNRIINWIDKMSQRILVKFSIYFLGICRAYMS